MTETEIQQILGEGKYLKVRYVSRGRYCDTDLCRPIFRGGKTLALDTEEWDGAYYAIRYDDIIAVKPKGAKQWVKQRKEKA